MKAVAGDPADEQDTVLQFQPESSFSPALKRRLREPLLHFLLRWRPEFQTTALIT
jgi:hypothetical protein